MHRASEFSIRKEPTFLATVASTFPERTALQPDREVILRRILTKHPPRSKIPEMISSHTREKNLPSITTLISADPLRKMEMGSKEATAAKARGPPAIHPGTMKGEIKGREDL